MDPATWSRIKEICADALEHDGEEREALVAERSGENTEVEREVKRLLAAHERAAPDFLEQPTGGPLTLALPFDAGRRLGAWELVEKLGAGGMGVVYLAERREADFEQRAALKVMRLAAPDEVLIERFQRERQLLAGLEHPNIAHLLDGGTTEEGVSYFAMEYVEGGRPIDQYCEEEALSTDERLDLFREVCAAVAHAHRNLVVHRDLKPSNILVTSDGTPKLLDFGIAKLLAEGPGDATVTRFQALTPDYASPEQVAGGPITTASDVYSLGVLLYRLLTGRAPFPTGTKPLAELSRERRQAPPRPSAVVDGADARRLRGDLDSIVLKALRPEPEQRYGSVEALADDVAWHRDGLPVGARRGTFTYLAGKFLRRHKAAAGAAALVALTLVGATVVSNRAATVAEAERAKAERISGFLQRMISSPDASWFSSGKAGRDVRVIDVLEESVQNLDTEEDLAPAEEAMIRRTFGMTYRGLGLYDEAVDLLQEAARLDRLSSGPGSRELAIGLYELGSTLYNKGDHEEAAGALGPALAIFRTLPGEPEEDMIKTINDLGLVLWTQGNLEEAEPHLREALELNLQRVGEVHPINAIVLSNIGLISAELGDLEEAGGFFGRALDTFRQLPEVSWEPALVLHNLGWIELYLGRLDNSSSHLDEAVEIATDKLGENHPTVAVVRATRADLSYRRGDLITAEQEVRAALAIHEASGTEHRNYPKSLTMLGRILTAQRRSEEAEPVLLQALEIRRGTLRPGNWRIGESAGALGECLAAQGRYAEAEALLSEGSASLEALFGPDFPLTREFQELLQTVQAARAVPPVEAS